MAYEHIIVERDGAYVTLTLNRPQRRNALSLALMDEVIDALGSTGRSDALGIVVAGNGPVFCAGHDFADMVGADLVAMRQLLKQCTTMMELLQAVPQVVVARVHGLATAAGCQLVASCDLAVAAANAAFALPGGRGGWFCHTPLVAVARNIGRKHALEMAFTGDPIDAATAAGWGLVNRVVPPAELATAALDLLRRATRGTGDAKGLGKAGFYAQVDLDQHKAYAHAVELMASTSQTGPAQERMKAFVEKRAPRYRA
ncbi:MAG: enoyl-CoA hydratase-related protein [Rhizobacter sp.]|nr:enoyl-CoA hydratase-related protein [Rhizobacter sp.]